MHIAFLSKDIAFGLIGVDGVNNRPFDYGNPTNRATKLWAFMEKDDCNNNNNKILLDVLHKSVSSQSHRLCSNGLIET